MPPSFSLASLGLILIVALAGAIIAHRLSQPLVVGYILAGITSSVLVTFFGLEVVIKQVAEIGVALLLFSIGLEFSFSRISRLKTIAGLGAVVQIVTVILLSLTILPVFKVSTPTALFIGSALALSSTALVSRILESRGELETWPGEITIGWLLVQDLAVLPLVVLLPTLIKTSGLNLSTFQTLLQAFLLVSLALIIGHWIVPLMIKFFADFNSRELLLLGVISLMLGFAVLTTHLGMGLAIGAFLAGILMSSTTAHYAIFAQIRPLRELFSIIFFVSLGLMISPTILISNLPLIILATFIVMITKFGLVWLILSYFNQHPRVKFLASSYLVQVGEFGFVIMQLGYQAGAVTHQIVSIISGVALASILFTPWLIDRVDRLYQRLCRHLIDHHHQPQIGQLEYNLNHHVIICGYGRVGKWLSRVLQIFKLPFIVIDFNRHSVDKLKSENIPAIYGDASDIEILTAALLSQARIVVITIPNIFTQQLIINHCRKINPRISIFTRAHLQEFQHQLKLQGANYVVQPEFEASLSLAKKVLRYFGKSRTEVAHKLQLLRLEHGTSD